MSKQIILEFLRYYYRDNPFRKETRNEKDVDEFFASRTYAMIPEAPPVRFEEEDQEEGQVLYVRAYVGAVEIGEATIDSGDQCWMSVEYRDGSDSCFDRGNYESREAALAAIKAMIEDEWTNTWNAFFESEEEA